jgi:hypothetical protein
VNGISPEWVALWEFQAIPQLCNGGNLAIRHQSGYSFDAPLFSQLQLFCL